MKKKIHVLFVIVISILICIVISFIPKIKMYSHRYKCKQELYKVKTTIDTNDVTFKALELFESDLENNEIFIAGESHGSVKSIDMNLYLLKYFVERGNVKYILYEDGYASAQYLNIYLDTGDESILENLFYKIRGTMSYTMENYNFLKSVYEYNVTLEEEKKLRFIGIDKENPLVAIKYIRSLLPIAEPTDDITEEFISVIKELSKSTYIDKSKEAIQLLSDGEKEIEKYLGEHYFDLTFTLKNLAVSEGQLDREELLINNFVELYEYLPKGKFFGQFGGAHTNLNPNTKSLAAYLQNNYEKTKDKVISINYEYNNSHSYIPQGLNVDSKLTDNIDQAFFPDDKSTVLLKLNYEDSIYYEKDIYLNDNNPQIKYFQYIILISDSQAANKYYMN
nr:MAG TPA: Ere-like protein [Caudoviricetes sp.]